MPDLLLIDAVGTCVAIDLEGLDADDRQAVREAWADALHTDDAVAPAATVTPRGSTRAFMLSNLSQQVTLAAIEERKGQLWMLHAAAVATDDGHVVVMVGPSGRGKTTAARTLGRHFGYLSDETVAIDGDGRVWPYRKPLSVIEEASAPKTQPAPSRLGLRPVPDAPLHVAAVVLLDRTPDGPETPYDEPVELGDALTELVAQSSYLAHMPAALRQIAAIADATGGFRRVRYREAETLPDLIRALAATPGRTPAPVEPYDDPDAVAAPTVGLAAAEDDGATQGPHAATTPIPDAAPEPLTTPARFWRTRASDALELQDPDRIVLLAVDQYARGSVRILAGIAPELWRAATGATFDDLVAAAVALHGAPDDGDAATPVLAAVDELCAQGVLISGERPLQRRDDVAWVDRPEQIVALALSVPGAQPLALPGSAAVYWEWLEDPMTATQIVARAVAETGAPVATVDADLRAFLATLEDAQLIARVPEGRRRLHRVRDDIDDADAGAGTDAAASDTGGTGDAEAGAASDATDADPDAD